MRDHVTAPQTVAKELLKDKGIPHSKTLLEHLLESIKKLSPNFFVGVEEQITPNSTQGTSLIGTFNMHVTIT